jgi:hypothetical protein
VEGSRHKGDDVGIFGGLQCRYVWIEKDSGRVLGCAYGEESDCWVVDLLAVCMYALM